MANELATHDLRRTEIGDDEEVEGEDIGPHQSRRMDHADDVVHLCHRHRRAGMKVSSLALREGGVLEARLVRLVRCRVGHVYPDGSPANVDVIAA